MTFLPRVQESFAGVEAELAESQRRRAELEAKERELQGLLDTHSREYNATATDFAEMEEMGRKKVCLIVLILLSCFAFSSLDGLETSSSHACRATVRMHSTS